MDLVWRTNRKETSTETLHLSKWPSASGTFNVQDKQTDDTQENDFNNDILLFEKYTFVNDPLDCTRSRDTSLCHKNHNSCK